MKWPNMKTSIFACCTLCFISIFSLVLLCKPSGGDGKSEIDFQILTDKAVYSPESTMHVKFIVTSMIDDPIYLHRDLYVCSGQLGFVFFQILDRNNADVRSEGCAGDIWPPGEDGEDLADPKVWILLRRGDIYGGSADFKLPPKKGTYRLKAELIPTGFTNAQKESLSQKHLRVLASPTPAPIVSVVVK
jgi:hypothetical protein